MASSTWPPLVISLPQLLNKGSDADFLRFLDRLTHFASTVQRNREYLADLLQVTPPQFSILMQLARLDGCEASTTQLAALLGVSLAFATMEGKKLIARRLLQRRLDPQDRRSVILGLTSKARDALRAVAPRVRASNDLLYASLTRKDMLVVARVLGTLVQHSNDVRNPKTSRSKEAVK